MSALFYIEVNQENWFHTDKINRSEVILNSEYTATINENEMTVGCQTFT